MQPLVFLLFVAVINVGVCQECAKYWTHSEGNCYAYGEVAVTWGNAQGICQTLGSTLVEVQTHAVHLFLAEHAWGTISTKCIWLGGNDIFHEGAWQWSSGSNDFNSFTKWNIKEPNDARNDEDCLSMEKKYDYKWNDKNCNKQCSFVCAKPALVAPTNST
ncbi:hypothetical protein BsWGS_11927 [Bradybaena similaris]